EAEGLYSAILPGGVPLPHVGEGSQPGIATHTLPLLSNVVPQGSCPAGIEKSVTLTPEEPARVERVLIPRTLKASVMLATSVPNATRPGKIFRLAMNKHPCLPKFKSKNSQA